MNKKLILTVLWHWRVELGSESAAHVLSILTAGWTPATQSPDGSSRHVREPRSGRKENSLGHPGAVNEWLSVPRCLYRLHCYLKGEKKYKYQISITRNLLKLIFVEHNEHKSVDKRKNRFLDIFMKRWGSEYCVWSDTMNLLKWILKTGLLLEGYTSCAQQFLLGLLRKTDGHSILLSIVYMPLYCILFNCYIHSFYNNSFPTFILWLSETARLCHSGGNVNSEITFSLFLY